MSLRDDLAGVLARDPRYAIHAYAFIFEAIEFTKTLRKQARRRSGRRARRPSRTHHISGPELCEGVRVLVLDRYGLMAMAVLAQWGIRSTADIGEVVYNLIASGDLERSDDDDRADFDDVYRFDDAFRRDYILELGEVA